MSADSFHHQVEESMKNMKNIYDFSDFETAVREANSRVVVKSMSPSDFSDWRDYSSAQKLRNVNTNRPLLNKIKHFRAKRGSKVLQYRLDYSMVDNMEEIDFLQVKIKRSGIPKPLSRITHRGISNCKKEDLKKLLYLMPKSRHSFWLNLSENDVADLVVDHEE